MDDLRSLPKHWEIKKLGEVCHTTSGGTPSRGNKQFYEGNIPWVKSGELNRGLIVDTEEKISEEAVKNSSAKVFPKGTLLIALYGATIGKLAFLGVDAATNQAICGIYKNEKVDSDYLYYFLFSNKQNLVKQGIGGAQPNISQGILKNLDLPLPSLAEQAAIVAKIEELLSDLENGKQQLLTAQAQLKVYRQSLLKWAFVNIKNQEIISVENCCTHIVDCLHSTAKFTTTGKYCVDTTCIENGRILFEKIRYVEEKTFQERIARLKPQSGDIFFAREGTVGTALIVPNNIEVCLGQRMMMFRLKDSFEPKYIMYYFQSPLFKSQYRPLIMGTTAPHLNIRDIKKFNVIKCSLAEQQRIVEELESKLTVCDKIEETISQSLAQAETLRQSILKKAFEGKLV